MLNSMSKLNLKLLNSNVAIDSDKPVYTQSRRKILGWCDYPVYGWVVFLTFSVFIIIIFKWWSLYRMWKFCRALIGRVSIVLYTFFLITSFNRLLSFFIMNKIKDELIPLLLGAIIGLPLGYILSYVLFRIFM